MLVLSRKQGERLVIGNDVVVIVNKVAGNRVTLAIEAPSEVRVVRGELSPIEKPQTQAKARLPVEAEAQRADAPQANVPQSSHQPAGDGAEFGAVDGRCAAAATTADLTVMA